MKCKTFKNQISAFQDGMLSPEKMKDMESHLHFCDHCREMVEESDAVLNMLSILPEPEPQPFFYARLKTRMVADKKKRNAHWIQYAVIPAMTTAMLALGIILGSMAGRYSQTTTQSMLDSDVFSELPLEELNLLSDDSYTSGYFDISDQNGGVK
ncbi:anti-sigma factor family protein [bacterium]